MTSLARAKQYAVTRAWLSNNQSSNTGTGLLTARCPLHIQIMNNKNSHTSKTPQGTKPQKDALADYVKTIEQCKSDEATNFTKLADAFYQIQEQELYLCANYPTEAAFFKEKLGYSRSSSLRLAKEGRLLHRLSSMEDKPVGLFTSDRHLRPLLKFKDGEQDAAITLARKWMSWADLSELSPKLMEAAVTFLHPSAPPAAQKESIEAQLAARFRKLVEEEKALLPEKTAAAILRVFDNLAKKVTALGGPRRSTGIDWTDATWNPLQGCTRMSSGCDNCYAAKLVATRMADVYPGLAITKSNGKCAFTGKIKLLPQELAEPLQDKQPKHWFVNSMSDLFHKGVPEHFISEVFAVMEKATWHQFQVLTKRPERMAAFTQKRYKDRQPPSNVWLGTSTEDQKAFDERYPHLKATKAAVRWLSIEPMLGPIKFSDTEGLDWVVVGGETGSDRRMQKTWVAAIRDQCAKAKVPFFFKQWGVFDENGNKLKKVKKEGLIPKATLDGVVYNAYPEPAATSVGRTLAGITATPAPKASKASAVKTKQQPAPKSA